MHNTRKKGIVTLAFDDAYLDTYKYAIKYLDKLNIKSTIAVPTHFIGKNFEKRPVVGIKELKDIASSGHEIASHTVMHSNLLNLGSRSNTDLSREITESRQTLQKLCKLRVSSFVFPYIIKNYSRSICLRTKAYYRSARITLDKPCFNHIPLKNSFPVVGFSIMKRHSLRFLNKQVDHAKRQKLWLIEVFHLIGKKNTLSAHRPKPYRFFMHIDDFKRHVDYILSKDLLVLTQGDAVKRLG
ncbi:MAG: polysaccharide deacetylase family protein [Candidatus Omnitrophota bacterium]